MVQFWTGAGFCRCFDARVTLLWGGLSDGMLSFAAEIFPVLFFFFFPQWVWLVFRRLFKWNDRGAFISPSCSRGGQYLAVFLPLQNYCLALCTSLGTTWNRLLAALVKRQWQHCSWFSVLPSLGTAAFVVSQTIVDRFLLVHCGLSGVVMLYPFAFVWQIASQDCFSNTH